GGTVGGRDRLVPQADAEHRYVAAEGLDQRYADPGPGRRARSGREQDPGWPPSRHLRDRQRVVAYHLTLGSELGEVLHQVVDERVVVVDDQDPLVHSVSYGISNGSSGIGDSRSSTRPGLGAPGPAGSPPGEKSPSSWPSSHGSSVSSIHGSIHGKTTNHSRAANPAASSNEPPILPGSPNGRCRQIHAYMLSPRPAPAGRSPRHSASQTAQYGRAFVAVAGLLVDQFGVDDQPFVVVPLRV